MDRPGINTEDAAQTDVRLLGRIQGRDQDALTELYDIRGQLVYSLVLNTVGNVADAEEVTQEVFLKVWQKAGMFDHNRGSVLAWLVTMTRRLAIDRTRSRHYKFQRKVVEVGEEQSAVATGQHEDPAHKFLLMLQVGEIKEAIGRLGVAHQEVIRLAYFEGLSHSEIASHLDKPLGTVKSRLREAMNNLRNFLDVKTN